ncbi:MAG: hypothetical protein J6R82_01285 [Clostridia bacterium]|nr:hypothetical protein [Clostridia bacterium]
MNPSRIKHTLVIFLLLIACLPILSCTSREKPLTTNQYNEIVHPCKSPKGYTYPKGADPYYKRHGIWLQEGFERPDLIWIGYFDYDDSVPSAGEIRYDNEIWKNVGDENSRYVVSLQFYADYDKEALNDYLVSLGWERLENQKGYYAATRGQIEALDCTALQTAIGCSTEHGIRIHTPHQAFHTHTEELPEGHVYSCAHPFE